MNEKEIAIVAEGIPERHRPCGVGQQRLEIAEAIEEVSAVRLAQIERIEDRGEEGID